MHKLAKTWNDKAIIHVKRGDGDTLAEDVGTVSIEGRLSMSPFPPSAEFNIRHGDCVTPWREAPSAYTYLHIRRNRSHSKL